MKQSRKDQIRAFEDGDYVFAHTEYDFAKSNIGFEVFQFVDDHAAEHWDNTQRRQGPNRRLGADARDCRPAGG